MTCSHKSCVPKARMPRTWVTVLASHPSVSMETETTQRMEPPTATAATRRIYSLLDLIELRLVGELTEMVAMQPANAAAIAKEVRELKGRQPYFAVWFEAGVPK